MLHTFIWSIRNSFLFYSAFVKIAQGIVLRDTNQAKGRSHPSIKKNYAPATKPAVFPTTLPKRNKYPKMGIATNYIPATFMQ